VTGEDETAPFGAFRPSDREARFRRFGRLLPRNWLGRKLASLLLGPAGGRKGEPLDVEVFGGARARLHPHDNICEKRVYLTPDHWDLDERAALAAAIRAKNGREFVFVDVGANAGLYTLFAYAAAEAAGVRLRALCIEPDPEMARRLAFNLEASGIDASIIRSAVSDAEGEAAFAPSPRSRGMGRLDATGGARVKTRPLLDILREAEIAEIDALKIDIEGHEETALAAFLRDGCFFAAFLRLAIRPPKVAACAAAHRSATAPNSPRHSCATKAARTLRAVREQILGALTFALFVRRNDPRESVSVFHGVGQSIGRRSGVM